MNQLHLLVAFVATLIALVVLAIVPGQGDIGGRIGLMDALGGLLLILGGAVAGAQKPTSGSLRNERGTTNLVTILLIIVLALAAIWLFIGLFDAEDVKRGLAFGISWS